MVGATEEVATGAEVGNMHTHTGMYSISDHNARELSSGHLCCCRWLTCWWPCAELLFSLHARPSYLNHTLLLLIHATPKYWLLVLRYWLNQSQLALDFICDKYFWSETITHSFVVTEKKLWQAANGSGQCLVNQEDCSGDSSSQYLEMNPTLMTQFRKFASDPPRQRIIWTLSGGFLTSLCLQGPYSEIKKQMDKIDPLAHPLLQWWVTQSKPAFD